MNSSFNSPAPAVIKTEHPPLRDYVSRLTAIFRKSSCKREAHMKSRGVMAEMSRDDRLLKNILQEHLATPHSLNSTNYPFLILNIEENPFYTLAAHCWIPLPDRKTNISARAVHHHGDILLTSTTLFGPGYEHWIFSKPIKVDSQREIFSLQLLERQIHALHHCAFVDLNMAHVPFYPPSLTVTIVLWSYHFPTKWRHYLKYIPGVRRHQDYFRKLAVRLRLISEVSPEATEYFEFYPSEEGFKGLKKMVDFQPGPNADYLYNLFHVLQRTGNEGLAPIVRRHLDSGFRLENPNLITRLLEELDRGRDIEGRLSEGYFGALHHNFTKEMIERALASVQSTPVEFERSRQLGA